MNEPTVGTTPHVASLPTRSSMIPSSSLKPAVVPVSSSVGTALRGSRTWMSSMSTPPFRREDHCVTRPGSMRHKPHPPQTGGCRHVSWVPATRRKCAPMRIRISRARDAATVRGPHTLGAVGLGTRMKTLSYGCARRFSRRLKSYGGGSLEGFPMERTSVNSPCACTMRDVPLRRRCVDSLHLHCHDTFF